MTNSGPTRRRSSYGFIATIALFAAVGLALRYYDIRRQAPADDEWHSLKLAATRPPWYVVQHYFKSATAIPVNVYLGWVLRTFGWSEISIRALTIVATIATFTLLPLVVLRVFGSRVASVLSVMFFALSPFWIFYGESLRPYAAYLLLMLAAYFFLHRGLLSNGLSSWLLFATAGALAAYFHLFALPALAFTSLVTAYTVAQNLRASGWGSTAFRRRLLHALLGYGTWLILVVALYAAPYLNGMRKALPSGHTEQFFTRTSFVHGVELLTGTRYTWVGALFLLGALVGIGRLVRQRNLFVALLGAGLLGSVLFTLVSRPFDFCVGLVFWRYNVTAFLLYFIGLGAFLREVGSRALAHRSIHLPWLPPQLATGIGTAAVALVLVAVSPIPRNLALRQNTFRLHSAFQQGYGDFSATRPYVSDMYGDTLEDRRTYTSPFYENLRGRGEPCRLIEYPLPIADHLNPFYFYELLDRCEVIGGYSTRTEIGDYLEKAKKLGALSFQSLVSVDDPSSIAATGADYLVVHLHEAKDIGENSKRVERLLRATRRVLEQLEADLGKPSYTDESLVVFPLKRTPSAR